MENHIELAWAAGFFDGEGCTRYTQNGPYGGLRSQIGQVFREPLDRFVKATGIGKVYGPYKSNQAGHRPYYQINISTKGSLALITLLWDYLSEPKQTQITRALVKYKNTC